MVWDDLARDAEDENRKDREKYIGVYIGILAVLLAICSLGGSNATKDATVLNIKAANTWAFFQAKNMRRHVVRVQLDEMELRLATEQGLSPDGKAAIAAKIKSYKDQDQALTNGKEGLDDLFAQAKAMEAERDIAMRRDPYFDWGGAGLDPDRHRPRLGRHPDRRHGHPVVVHRRGARRHPDDPQRLHAHRRAAPIGLSFTFHLASSRHSLPGSIMQPGRLKRPARNFQKHAAAPAPAAAMICTP